jgi:hypothetical protein
MVFNVVDPARVHKRNNESGGISLYDEENAESGEPGQLVRNWTRKIIRRRAKFGYDYPTLKELLQDLREQADLEWDTYDVFPFIPAYVLSSLFSRFFGFWIDEEGRIRIVVN